MFEAAIIEFVVSELIESGKFQLQFSLEEEIRSPINANVNPR